MLQQKKCSLRRLLERYPGLPRNSTLAYLHRWRWLQAQRRRRRRHKLKWLVPGAAWAIDGTWLDVPVCGTGRRALVVVELHSKKRIAFEPVRGERVGEVVRLLDRLVAQHGPPLVLKLDNGSAFIAWQMRWWAERHGVVLMHSPVRQPSWNGTCEVSGKHGKRVVMAAAGATTSSGVRAVLQPADLACAVNFVGEMPRVDDGLRQAFHRVVAEQLAIARQARGLAAADDLRDDVRRSLGRVATRAALQMCHILKIEGRGYRW